MDTIFETVCDLKRLQGAGGDNANGTVSVTKGVHRLVGTDCNLGDGGGQSGQELLRVGAQASKHAIEK